VSISIHQKISSSSLTSLHPSITVRHCSAPPHRHSHCRPDRWGSLSESTQAIRDCPGTSCSPLIILPPRQVHHSCLQTIQQTLRWHTPRRSRRLLRHRLAYRATLTLPSLPARRLHHPCAASLHQEHRTHGTSTTKFPERNGRPVGTKPWVSAAQMRGASSRRRL
jgi:hypothetical protein